MKSLIILFILLCFVSCSEEENDSSRNNINANDEDAVDPYSLPLSEGEIPNIFRGLYLGMTTVDLKYTLFEYGFFEQSKSSGWEYYLDVSYEYSQENYQKKHTSNFALNKTKKEAYDKVYTFMVEKDDFGKEIGVDYWSDIDLEVRDLDGIVISIEIRTDLEPYVSELKEIIQAFDNYATKTDDKYVVYRTETMETSISHSYESSSWTLSFTNPDLIDKWYDMEIVMEKSQKEKLQEKYTK